MATRNCGRGGIGLGLLFFLVMVVGGCGGGSREEPSDIPANRSMSPSPEGTAQESKAGESGVTPSSSPQVEEAPGPVSSSFVSRASVLASKELGMSVSGKGADEPSRSLEVLEQQVLAFLPQLQEVYDHGRELDPNLMGSLDVNLTIEPGGQVSDLRFPVRRVFNDRLVSAVFDQMRAWTFPPAGEQVQLRCRLLFVPPGLDLASVMTWEKQLGSHAVVERSEEKSVATTPAPTSVSTPAPKPAKPSAPPAASSGAARPQPPEPIRPAVSGWYRVTKPTLLRSAPRTSSEIITRLPPGTRVRIVGVVEGEWLEVRSVSNRPPGFLHRADASPEVEDGTGR